MNYLSPFALFSLLAPLAAAQDFGPMQTISAEAARRAHAADVDGDGDMDVLVVYETGVNKLTLFENLGGGSFGQELIVTNQIKRGTSVVTADVDGDGVDDLLTTSYEDGKVAWYPHVGMGAGVGGGPFGDQVVIAQGWSAQELGAWDFDEDGDLDVLFARSSNYLVWAENDGTGQSWVEHTISSGSEVDGCVGVAAGDLNGDSHIDALSVSRYSGTLTWFAGDGSGGFSSGVDIDTQLDHPHDVHVEDLDLDGDLDVLGVSFYLDLVTWYENDGFGKFGQRNVITNEADFSTDVHTVDLDLDGWPDVLSASQNDGTVAWYRNLGGGQFGGREALTTELSGAMDVSHADFDGDGYPDVLAVGWWGSTGSIVWFENLMEPPDCNGNGVPDADDIANGSSADCDGDGVPDECQIADDPALDCDSNGVIDSCEWADCDGDDVLDACQIASDPTLDWNGDGVLDECTPPNYCSANPNSTGQSAVMSLAGTPVVTANDFTLTASQMPTFEFGYFLTSAAQGFVPNVGGSAGNLCLGAPLYRFIKPPTGTVLSSGSSGSFSFTPNLVNLPQGIVFAAGDTWNFQAWYRDGAAGSSNFTDGVEVLFL